MYLRFTLCEYITDMKRNYSYLAYTQYFANVKHLEKKIIFFLIFTPVMLQT